MTHEKPLDRCREPTLDEILSEEIIAALMAADRVDRYELQAMLMQVARSLGDGVPLQPSDAPWMLREMRLRDCFAFG